MTIVYGTSGRDDLILPSDDSDTEVFAGAGDDYITIKRRLWQPGTLSVDAGDGDDKIWVEDYATSQAVVHGGAGSDTIYLNGGGLIYGDSGSDTFRLKDGGGIKYFTVADFSYEDKLDILSYFEGNSTSPFADGLIRFVQSGADALLQLPYNNWQTYGIFKNVDASKLTPAQLGGLRPVVINADQPLSMSVDVTTVMEGGKILVQVTLPAPMSKPVQVAIFNSGMGNESKITYLDLAVGQTKAQTYVVVEEENFTGPRNSLKITAGISGAIADPSKVVSATINVINNDQNGFVVNIPDLRTVYLNLTGLDAIKPGDQAQLPGLALMATRDLVRALETLILPTTSVALTAYQFFTGKSPGQAGLKYLVNSPDNASDLNDAGGIYAAMNTENRYINFAANLGLVGEGKAAFAAAYGGLTFRQAIDKAYDAVIGKAYAQAAGINISAAIDSVMAAQGYFDALATQRMGGFDHDLAMKAGMVGYLIAEGQKAHIGAYARAVENFYIDFMDGTAQHNVNLVAVYGPGTFLDAI